MKRPGHKKHIKCELMTTKGFLWATEKNGAHTPRRGDYAREVTWDLPVVGF